MLSLWKFHFKPLFLLNGETKLIVKHQSDERWPQGWMALAYRASLHRTLTSAGCFHSFYDQSSWVTDWWRVHRKDTTRSSRPQLPAQQRPPAEACSHVRSGHTDEQPSFAATAGPGAVENGSVTGNRQADTLLLMEVEEGVRDPGSIISGSWYSRELKYSLL